MRAVAWLFFLSSLPTISLAVSRDYVADKASLRRKYSYLYSEKVRTISTTESRFHKARLHRYAGLNVLSVEGDVFEMAFQHAKLLEREMHDSAAMAASQMVTNAIDVTYGHRPAFAAIAKAHIDNQFNDALLSNVVRDYPDRSKLALHQLFAVAEAAAIPLHTLIDAALNPSVLMMLANGSRVNNEKVILPPFNGCSSFAAWDSYSADGKLIVARNTDYPLTGPFERHATAIYFHPNTGQKHVAIITAGVHSTSVTAINESGIFLAMHSLPSTHTGKTGVPPILWLNDIIAESTTVADLVTKLTALRYDVGWTFVIASEKEKRVLSLEVDNSGFGIRESKSGKHVQTNHFLSPELSAHTLHFNSGTRDETFNRYDRLQDLVEAARGKIEISDAIRFLGDRYNLELGESYGYPSVVAAPTTATSLVYKPSSKALYVATGSAPVSGNRFVQLPLPQDFDASVFASWRGAVLEDTTFRKLYPHRERALKKLIEAKQRFEYDNDAASALALVTQAAKEANEVAYYVLMQGLFEIRVGKFSAAKASLGKALGGTLTETGRSVANYYLGRIAAQERRAADASAYLQTVLKLNSSQSKISQAAQEALQAVSKWGFYALKKSDVIPQIQFGDSQVY
jgi:tetratricopeptide (TPR) repeat protein